MNRNNVVHLQYTSHTPVSARRKALELLKRSEISALLAIDCLDEGVDVPDVRGGVRFVIPEKEKCWDLIKIMACMTFLTRLVILIRQIFKKDSEVFNGSIT